MIKGKKSEYETDWICGIDESCTEMGMVVVLAGAGRGHVVVALQKGWLD